MLRHIRDFIGVVFKIDKLKSEPIKEGENEEEEESGKTHLQFGGEKLSLTCVGSGYSNISKTVL